MKFVGKRRKTRVISGTLALLVVALAAALAFGGTTGYYSWYPYYPDHFGHGHSYYSPMTSPSVVNNEANMTQTISGNNYITNEVSGNYIANGYGSLFSASTPSPWFSTSTSPWPTFPTSGGDNDGVDIENISQNIDIVVNGNIDQN